MCANVEQVASSTLDMCQCKVTCDEGRLTIVIDQSDVEIAHHQSEWQLDLKSCGMFRRSYFMTWAGISPTLRRAAA